MRLETLFFSITPIGTVLVWYRTFGTGTVFSLVTQYAGFLLAFFVSVVDPDSGQLIYFRYPYLKYHRFKNKTTKVGRVPTVTH